MNRRFGFTLVELLAVIVILAIILAIAVPGISGIVGITTKNAFALDAKAILRQLAEKTSQDRTFDVTSTNLETISGLDVSSANYQDLSVSLIDDQPYIIITGKEKWEGLTACGTYQSMVVGNGDDCITVGNGPLISNVQINNITKNSAAITFTLDKAGTSVIEYGTSTSLGETLNNSNLNMSHSDTLTGLIPNATYYFKIISKDSSGNSSFNDNDGHLYTFKTVDSCNMAGSGTEVDPYVITTICEFQHIRDNPSAYYIVANDIDASDTLAWEYDYNYDSNNPYHWPDSNPDPARGKGFKPIGLWNVPFSGHIDGQHHIIKNIYEYTELEANIFGYTEDATIKNLGLESLNLTSTGDYAEALFYGLGDHYDDNYVVYIDEYTIDNVVDVPGTIVDEVYATGKIESKVASASGFIKENQGAITRISNCYTNTTVESPSDVTGLETHWNYSVGEYLHIASEVHIVNSYSVVKTTNDIGMYAYGGTDTKWKYIVLSTGATYAGEGTAYEDDTLTLKEQSLYSGWDFTNIWAIDSVKNEGYPTLKKYD